MWKQREGDFGAISEVTKRNRVRLAFRAQQQRAVQTIVRCRARKVVSAPLSLKPTLGKVRFNVRNAADRR